MNTKLSAKTISSGIYNDLIDSGNWTADEAQGLQICFEAALNLAFDKVKRAGMNMEDLIKLPEVDQRKVLKPMIDWVLRLITDQEVARLLAEAPAGNLAYPTSTTLH
jgi:hypothetical protein